MARASDIFNTEIESAVQQLVRQLNQDDLFLAAEGVCIMASQMSTIVQYRSFRNGLMTSLQLLLAIVSKEKENSTIFEALQQQGGGLRETAIALAANIYAWDRYIETEQSLANQQRSKQPLTTLTDRIRSVFKRGTKGGTIDEI